MKTNNNALVLVVTLVVLFVAGYFLFRKPKVEPLPVIPDNTDVTDVVVSKNSVFIDQEKTFTFTYPNDLFPDDIRLNQQDWRSNTQDVGTLIVKITIPKGFEPQTNLSDSRFTVGVSSDAKSVKNCLVATNGEQLQGKETINEVLYSKFTLGDAGAGNFYDTTSYRTLQDKKCYAVEYTIHSTNIGAYDPSQGIKEFNKQKITAVLESISHSFVFLEPDVVQTGPKERIKIEPL